MSTIPETKTIDVIITTLWLAPQSSVYAPNHSESAVRYVRGFCIPKTAAVVKAVCAALSFAQTPTSTWRVYLCRTQSFGPDGWAAGLREIAPGATFEDLERDDPKIKTYSDLAIHIKVPVQVTCRTVEVPSLGIRVPFPQKTLHTTMSWKEFYATIVRCITVPSVGGIPAGRSPLPQNMRVRFTSSFGRETMVAVTESDVPIGTCCAFEGSTEAEIVIVSEEAPIPLTGDDKKRGLVPLDKALVDAQNRLKMLEAIQQANLIKRDLEKQTAWVKHTAGSDMHDLVEDYLFK